jgi:hypothetical protein
MLEGGNVGVVSLTSIIIFYAYRLFIRGASSVELRVRQDTICRALHIPRASEPWAHYILAFDMNTPVRFAMLMLAAALAACSTNRSQPEAAAPPTQAAIDGLAQVRDRYQAGTYGDVIRTVATSDALATAPVDMRIEALKLQAFSYCVTGYRVLCEDDFKRILGLDPKFELSPAEVGHPVWGPAFQRAKAAQGG